MEVFDTNHIDISLVDEHAQEPQLAEEQQPTRHTCAISGENCLLRQVGGIELPWPRQLFLKQGSRQLLDGVQVLHDFEWVGQFGHNRSQFRNGKKLARLARKDCPIDCQPILLLTVREEVRHRAMSVTGYRILVVNVRAYLAVRESDAAASFFAGSLSRPITELADLDLSEIVEWTKHSPGRANELQRALTSLVPFDEVPNREQPGDVVEILKRCSQIGTDDHYPVLDRLVKLGVGGADLLRKAIEVCSTDELTDVMKSANTYEGRSVINALANCGLETILNANAVLGIATCRALLRLWDDNRENSNEEFWQQSLTVHSFVISQIFAAPVVVVRGKVYVGGKGLDNAGGKIADFLCTNTVTENAALVEIKTPATPLLAHSSYRDGVFAPSSELTGAIVQVLDQKDSLTKECYQLNSKSDFHTEVFDPRCVVIAGNCESLTTADRLKSFELYRNNSNGVVVLAFDELFERIRHLVELMEKGRFQIEDTTR